MKKFLFWTVVLAFVLAAGGFLAYRLSPWPSVLLIRRAFEANGAAALASVAPLVPERMSIVRDVRYGPQPEARLDVYAPPDAAGALPAVVWIHGGGFFAGSRKELSGYLQILASHGFVAAAIDYTLAPTAQFPTPLLQTSEALSFIRSNAERFNIDPEQIFLGGDSAGAQIAAQMALVISDAEYARGLGVGSAMSREALKGVVLFCGPYDPSMLNFEGAFGGFMRTVIWSYLGTKDPKDPRVARIAVAPHVTPNFPPTFISVGNADPLAPQSTALAEALRAQGVETDTLFFPVEHEASLPHEYQLLVATPHGRLAMDRMVSFLRTHAAPHRRRDEPPME